MNTNSKRYNSIKNMDSLDYDYENGSAPDDDLDMEENNEEMDSFEDNPFMEVEEEQEATPEDLWTRFKSSLKSTDENVFEEFQSIYPKYLEHVYKNKQVLKKVMDRFEKFMEESIEKKNVTMDETKFNQKFINTLPKLEKAIEEIADNFVLEVTFDESEEEFFKE